MSGLLLFGLALGLRWGVINRYDRPLTGDETGYEEAAWSLARGEGFRMQGRITYKAPLYSFFIAAIYRVAGRDLAAVRKTQAWMGAVLCLLLVCVGQLLFQEKIGWIAGWMAAIYPPLIALTARFLSEGVFTFFLMTTLLAWIYGLRNPGLLQAFGIGILCGLAALTRSVGMGLGLVLAGVSALPHPWIATRPPQGKRILFAGMLLLGSAAVMAPWTGRNWIRTGHWIPISTETGRAFYAGWVGLKEGKILGFNPVDETTERAERIPSEFERDRFLISETFQYLQQHLGEIPRLVALKTLYFFSPIDWEVMGNPRGVYQGFFVAITPFALLAIFTLARHSPQAPWVLFPLMLYTFCAAILFAGLPRFRLPIEPFWILLAAGGMSWTLSGSPQRHPARSIAVLGWFLLQGLGMRFSFHIQAILRRMLEYLGIW